jgi:hypothetical protein
VGAGQSYRGRVDIDPVDPRDIEWESDKPTYRVYFWGRTSAPPEIPADHVGYYAREYRVRGADDVHEVTRWAESAAAPEETYTLHVESGDSGSPGLILLAGKDPTVPDPEPAPRLELVKPSTGSLELEQVDLDDLANALQDQSAYDVHRWLLDRSTGEVLYWTSEVGLADPEPLDLEEADHLIPIWPLPSGVWYGDMADFADELSDDRAASLLVRSIRGKGAFRRFKEALHDGHPDLLPVWYAFHDARARRRAVDWLRDHDLVSDDVAETFFAKNPDPSVP